MTQQPINESDWRREKSHDLHWSFPESWRKFLDPDLRTKIALGSLTTWLLLLSFEARLPSSGVGMLVTEAIALLALMRWRATNTDKPIVEILFFLALPLFTLEILLVQSLPFWSDRFSDSRLYDAHARALVMHWQSQGVPTADFRLKGLIEQGIDTWLPNADFDYATVLGMSRYAYQLFLAGIYDLTDDSRTTAILLNAPILAGTAAGTYLVSREWFGQPSSAALAALLVMIDTNFAVWGSVLLRESLMELLVLLSFLSLIRLLKNKDHRWLEFLVVGPLLFLLAMLRFNAAAALLLALGSAIIQRPSLPSLKSLMIGSILLTLLTLATAYLLPKSLGESLPGRLVHENLRIFEDGSRLVVSAVLGKPDNGERVNSVRQKWHEALRNQPLWLNGTKAITRSLLAPYPWVALTHGLKGNNFYELMYPGMTLWLLSLPAFFFALSRLPILNDPSLRLWLIWWITVSIIYIIGYGEFGGRERMMAMPMLWIFAAEGLRQAKIRHTVVAQR